MWMRKFKGPDALFHLWSDMSMLYPCERGEEENYDGRDIGDDIIDID
jgi:hypothetical protein